MLLSDQCLNRSFSYLCSSCAKPPPSLKFHSRLKWIQRRAITQNHLRRIAEEAETWASQALEIKAGRRKSLLSTLEERGYIHQVVGERDDLDRLMTQKRVGVYVGFDPTAPSLHVGHLLPLMALFWLFVHGCHSVTLLGGATAKIGDPTDRLVSRETTHRSVNKINMATMHIQLKKLWLNTESHVKKHGFRPERAWHRELVNNNMWLNKLGILEMLQLVGSGIRIGTMLGKETVRNKLEKGDGMSLSEFVYPTLQSFDWWHMYDTKGIQVQIGGSDQFGNILAGIDTINHIRKTHHSPVQRQEKDHFLNRPMGFTVPLLTSPSGEKFGKSAGQAVWLDRDMTSTFDFYQYFVRTSDVDVGRYLKLFTFMSMQDIELILQQHEENPSARVAQHKLAREVVEIVHGKDLAEEAAKQHGLIFQSASSDKSTLKKQEVSSGEHLDSTAKPNAHYSATNAPSPHLVLPKSLIYDQPISHVLVSAGLADSKSEAARLVTKGGAYIGSRPGKSGMMGDSLEYTPAQNWFSSETEKYIIDGDLIILRVGKWRIKIIRIVSDEEFKRQGLTAPLWDETLLKKKVYDLDRQSSNQSTSGKPMYRVIYQ